MQSVKEGLDKAYKEAGQNAYFENGFKSGVVFAQRWIDIEEVKPEHYELNGLEYMDNPVLVKKGDQIRLIKSFYQLINFTHWRPIEYPLL